MLDSGKKTQHRRLRITLRTLLIAVTAFCIFLGWYANKARQQRQAVQWLTEHGALVAYAYEVEFVRVGTKRKVEPPYPEWLVNFLGVDYFANVSLVQILALQKNLWVNQMFFDGSDEPKF